jgi:hypothetical protein
MDSSGEVLVLDQPCEYCKVLEIDDTQHGGVVQEAEGGKRFVQFKKPAKQDVYDYKLSLVYRREKEDSKMMITDVDYMYRFAKHNSSDVKNWDDDQHSSDWLSLLTIFIEIDWGSKKKEYSLQYQIYADACGMMLLWLIKPYGLIALT